MCSEYIFYIYFACDVGEPIKIRRHANDLEREFWRFWWIVRLQITFIVYFYILLLA